MLELLPDDVASFSGRAYAHRKLGRFVDAAADYGDAIRRQPDAPRLYTNRAYCYAKAGQYGRAVQDYSAVLRLDPGNVHALHNRCADRKVSLGGW